MIGWLDGLLLSGGCQWLAGRLDGWTADRWRPGFRSKYLEKKSEKISGHEPAGVQLLVKTAGVQLLAKLKAF